MDIDEKLDMLYQNNLGKLMRKYANAYRKVQDILPEINLVCELIQENSKDKVIRYEDNTGYESVISASPDFIIEKEGKKYCIQVKRLSTPQWRKDHEKLFYEIEEELGSLKYALYYELNLSSNFKETDRSELFNQIKEKLEGGIKFQQEYTLEIREKVYAKIKFYEDKQSKNMSLRRSLIQFDEYNFCEIDNKKHIEGCLEKAAEAFKKGSIKNDVSNFIAVEMDNIWHWDIIFNEVVFGDVKSILVNAEESNNVEMKKGIRFINEEDKKGFFEKDKYIDAVVGILLMKPNEEKDNYYTKTLLVNKKYEDEARAITNIMRIDEILTEHSYLDKY